MALVLKENEVYSSQMGEKLGASVTTSTAYAMIDQVQIDKRRNELTFVVAVFGSKTIREGESGSIDNIPVMVRNEEFTTLIGQPNLLAACYNLISGNDIFSQFESDET